MGLVVLGLDQGRAHLRHHCHDSDLDPLCDNPQIPAPLVVLFWARFLAYWARSLLPAAAYHRPSVLQVRAPRPKGTGADREPRAHGAAGRRRHPAGAHVLDGRRRETDRAKRLRDRIRHLEAHRRLGYDHQEDERAANRLCRRPRDGPLRSVAYPQRARILRCAAIRLFLSRLPLDWPGSRPLGRQLEYPRLGRLGLPAGFAFSSSRIPSAALTAATMSIKPTNTPSRSLTDLRPTPAKWARRPFKFSAMWTWLTPSRTGWTCFSITTIHPSRIACNSR